MGKPKSKGGRDTEDGTEEGDEKERVAGHPQVLSETEKDEWKLAGVGPGVADPAPTPAPRKRGRPRKVVPKVEENSALAPQQTTAAAVDSESKKLKKVENSSTLNGIPSNQQSSIGTKLSTCVPLRREGSRRKSEPRRAAD